MKLMDNEFGGIQGHIREIFGEIEGILVGHTENWREKTGKMGAK